MFQVTLSISCCYSSLSFFISNTVVGRWKGSTGIHQWIGPDNRKKAICVGTSISRGLCHCASGQWFHGKDSGKECGYSRKNEPAIGKATV